MTEGGYCGFSVPRRLIEAWYLLSLKFPNRDFRSATFDFLPFRLMIIREREYLVTCISVSSMVLIQCRPVLGAVLSGAWRWNLDLAPSLRAAMALSEFTPHFRVSANSEISISFPENSQSLSAIAGSPFDAKNAIEVLSSIWVPLPMVDGDVIRDVAHQVETIVDWWEDARLSLDNGHMTLWARQVEAGETIAEFDLGQTMISGVSLSLPRSLLDGLLLRPLASYRLAFCASCQRAALLLSDDTAIVFSAKVDAGSESACQRDQGIPLVSLLRPVGIKASDRSPSWLDNFDDHFLEGVRYVLVAPGTPCATFTLDIDGGAFFEIARLKCDSGDSFISLNFSHHNNYHALRQIAMEVKSELGLNLDGAGSESVTGAYASVQFDRCRSPLNLRGPVREILRIMWGVVPQVFSRVEWRNLDKEYSGLTTILDRYPERKCFVGVRFDRDRQPREFVKALYDNQCQVCGHKIIGSNRSAYSEAHHIRFLNQNGPDIVGNMLVLCPTHHKEFDLSILALDPASCRIIAADPTHPLHDKAARVSSDHRLDQTCLEWALIRQQLSQLKPQH